MAVPYTLTKDGFESQIGTNHLGHFALTNLLLPKVTDRVVTVSSFMHLLGKISLKDLNWKARPYSAWLAYGQSKLANLLFTYELDHRLERASGKRAAETIAVAAHPGGSYTALARNVPTILHPAYRVVGPLIFQSAAMGALPTLRAATDPGVRGGQYYGPDGIGEQRGNPKLVESSPRSHDPELQQRLWAVSEELTGVTFAV
jgi:NAD(P)-dependent dehydrogenase (short-subunit alcohol dehydrogenase family)